MAKKNDGEIDIAAALKGLKDLKSKPPKKNNIEDKLGKEVIDEIKLASQAGHSAEAISVAMGKNAPSAATIRKIVGGKKQKVTPSPAPAGKPAAPTPAAAAKK